MFYLILLKRSIDNDDSPPVESGRNATLTNKRRPHARHRTLGRSTFAKLELKHTVKLHKSPISDCLFIDSSSASASATSSVQGNETPLPLLVCTVSSGERWLKLYSLLERSMSCSHDLAGLGLTSLTQPTSTSIATAASELSSSSSSMLFVSSLDGLVRVYDMDYSRCVQTLANLHDDATSRVRFVPSLLEGGQNHRQQRRLMMTSSWDSTIKLWTTTTTSANHHAPPLRTKFVCEICHDSMVVDFELAGDDARMYLATICDDGSLYVWRMNAEALREQQRMSSSEVPPPADSLFAFCFAIEASDDTLGKIVDCKLHVAAASADDDDDDELTASGDKMYTLAVCTTNGFVKVYNVENECELVSLRLQTPVAGGGGDFAKLTKIAYAADYVIAVDASGHVYFVDVESRKLRDAERRARGSVGESASVRHTIKLCDNKLTSLAVHNESLVCVGDADGHMYFLSLFDF